MGCLDGVGFVGDPASFALHSFMSVIKPPLPPASPETPASERVDSWKEIASYLKRDERTVRRWEKEGLPIHRHMHKKRATVYAYKSEIDIWWRNGRSRLESAEAAAAGRRRFTWLFAGLLAATVVGLGLNASGLLDRLLGRPVAVEVNSIAALPLRNLSADP